jgi:hypothetical protein
MLGSSPKNVRKLRIAELRLRWKAVKLIQVESYIACNYHAGRQRFGELSRLFPEEIVLIGFSGARRHYFGDPLTVRQIMALPPFAVHWTETAEPA